MAVYIQVFTCTLYLLVLCFELKIIYAITVTVYLLKNVLNLFFIMF